MADTRLTPTGFWRAAALCLRVLFAPSTMAALEEADERIRRALPPGAPESHRAHRVQRAFWRSFSLVCGSVAVGALLGLAARRAFKAPDPGGVVIVQAIGAGLLLWGTLFVRGWDIQTLGGVTLTERANQWVYRSLYCLGTGVISFSLTWPR